MVDLNPHLMDGGFYYGHFFSRKTKGRNEKGRKGVLIKRNEQKKVQAKFRIKGTSAVCLHTIPA